MKKLLLLSLLTINSFALTCSNSSGYKIVIDENARVELTTPSEVIVSEKAMINGSYYFGNFDSNVIRSFTLDSNRGELKLIETTKGTRINKQQVSCSN